MELEVYATHIASKVLSEALLGVDPDIAVCRELILHATADPGQEDSAVLWSTNLLPRHGSHLLDDLGRIEEIRVGAIDVELRGERIFVSRDEMHMGQLSVACQFQLQVTRCILTTDKLSRHSEAGVCHAGLHA